MNPSDMPEILEIVEILEPYITTKKRGTGLGLAIVLKIIQEHKGIFYIFDKKENTCALIEIPRKV